MKKTHERIFFNPKSTLKIEIGYVDSLWEEYAQIDIADVVVDIDAPDLQSSYSYRVPEALQNTLQAGDCVHIPFAGRETLGYVLDRRKLASNDPLCGKLKEIIASSKTPSPSTRNNCTSSNG